MGKITIKNMSTLTETAALHRVIAFIGSDMLNALYGYNRELHQYNEKPDISIKHISRSFGIDEYIVSDVN